MRIRMFVSVVSLLALTGGAAPAASDARATAEWRAHDVILPAGTSPSAPASGGQRTRSQ